MKRKLKHEEYKHCLEATQSENKIKQLEKKKIDVDNLRENLKEFIKKHNKLIFKPQKRVRSKKHNVFTEEAHNTALSANDDKITQLTYSVET